MNQDVSETCIPPINAQRLGSSGVLEKNFLDFLVLWVVSEEQRYFLGVSGPVPSFGIAEWSFAADLLGSPLAVGNNTTRISSVQKKRCHFLGFSHVLIIV